MRTPPAIVCFGEVLVDFLALPPRDDDAPRLFAEYAGGAPANVAVAVARLGGRARFVGMLGQDMFGDRLEAQLRAAGVDTTHIRRTGEAKTALAFVSLDAQGERSFSFYRPPSADLLFRADDFDAGSLEDAAVFHCCSNSLTEPGIATATVAGMRLARAAGALVSMDLNLRPSLWPAGVDPAARAWGALAEADLVKLSADELAFLARTGGGPDAVVARLLGGRTQCLVVTDGAAPLRWFTRAGQGTVPTFAVQVLDTTAAGDAFVGGWLQALVEAGLRADTLATFFDAPQSLADALRRGAAVGALATTRHGAFAAMPTRQDADDVLRAARP